jgi:hypothetical protein
MKALMLFFVLICFSLSAHANELVEFNGQEFSLKSGCCMVVYKGNNSYGWAIARFESEADKRIAETIASMIAKNICSRKTTGCEFYKGICAE